MTVLGSGKEKADDKEQLVAKGDVAMMMPNRHRLVRLQRRRTIITLILSIGFLFILLCGIFLTVCFIKKIGPFRRHISGHCPVGSKRFNGQKKVFESYEITDKYALIHVPRFNFKHGTFDSVRTLHVFDKKVTVIQHNNICLVKPMMKYQMLRIDWFDKLRLLVHHKIHTPRIFAHFHLRMVHPQLPKNYLRDEVHHLAEAICGDRPVFRLVFQIQSVPTAWGGMCNKKCNNCKESNQITTWKIIGGIKCQVCECVGAPPQKVQSPLQSSNKVDANCKTIRCENKCVNKQLIGCVQCKCADPAPLENPLPAPGTGQVPPVKNDFHLPPMIIEEKDNPITESSNFIRNKRSSNTNCKVVAKIYEGYTPADRDNMVPLDIIYDC